MAPGSPEDPSVVWIPSTDYIVNSHLHRFMVSHNAPNLDALRQRSIQDRSWYWQAVVDYLGIEFYKPFERVLDASRGVAFTQWFVGSEFNAAHNCLDRHAGGDRRNQVALISEREDGQVRRWTYRELYEEVSRLASRLQRLGVQPGDRVGLFLPLCLEAAAALLACAKLGAVALPIPTQVPSEAIAAYLNGCAARLLITADAFQKGGKVIPLKERAGTALAHVPSVERVLVVRHQGVHVPWDARRDLWYHEALPTEPRRFPSRRLSPEHPLLLTHTSGTTGPPKGAVLVHAGFLVNCAHDMAFCLDVKASDTLLWVTDMGWVMGPWSILGALALGSTVLLYEGAFDYPDHGRLLALIERHGVTVFGLTPLIVRSLMRHGDEWVDRHDLSSLRILAGTGEPWTQRPYHWFFEQVGKRRCPVINLAGGAELGGEVFSSFCILPIKAASFSGPVPGMDADVFDDDGKPIRGAPGNLVLRGPWPGMTRGFFQDPERYLASYWCRWPDVWSQGDWASVDRDSYWYIHGRTDDTIRYRGRRWGAEELEALVMQHPLVAECAAVGVPAEAGEDRVIVLAVPVRPGAGRQMLREVRALLSGHRWCGPPGSLVYVVGDLPKTNNAKILRRVIRALLIGQEPGDLSTLQNPESLADLRRVVG